MTSTPQAPFPLNEPAVAAEWIHEITGADPETVRQRLQAEHQRLGANVADAMRQAGATPYQFDDKLAALYAGTDAFLYETYTWNRFAMKQNMRKVIIDFLHKNRTTAQKVLAFGDGLGFDAVGLALAGHHVTYFEVGERSAAFARRVFTANHARVEVCSDIERLPREGFDAVICLDVLEHVPEPAGLVQKLATYLKSGGYLIVHAPFWYLHPNVSTHLAANQKYSGDWRQLYGQAGLTPVAAALAWNPLMLVKNNPAERMPLTQAVSFRLGQILLRFSRYWNQPLVMISLLLLNRERKRLFKACPLFSGNQRTQD